LNDNKYDDLLNQLRTIAKENNIEILELQGVIFYSMSED